MDVRIEPHALSGAVAAIPSKSMAHRLLILAGTVGIPRSAGRIGCPVTSADIEATIRCLEALGTKVSRNGDVLRPIPLPGLTEARPAPRVPRNPVLDCGESGSTLRFLLPVVAALGCCGTFRCAGRLAQRPLEPLLELLAGHGVRTWWEDAGSLRMEGTLRPGAFVLPGDVSSQFATGLLLAAPLMAAPGPRGMGSGRFVVYVREPVESLPYIDLTVSALEQAGYAVARSRERVDGSLCQRFELGARTQEERSAYDRQSLTPLEVEGDWSNAAFWLAAGAMGNEPITVSGLDLESRQGDRAVMAALALFGARVGRGGGLVGTARDALHACDLDISSIPDLAAPLAAVAAVAPGETRLTGAARLRLKESDRLVSISEAITALGGMARIEDDSLVIEGVAQLDGGTVDACNDHRIAMMAAICAANAAGPSTIRGASCVDKSYPAFFDHFRSLGGIAQNLEA